MGKRPIFGYPVGRVVMGAIILASSLFTVILVTPEDASMLYGGLAIGVGLVVFAGGVSYVATKQAEDG